jgi:hypothetical protein
MAHTKDLLAQLLLHALKHRANVIQELIRRTIPLHDLPQVPWLLEVTICQISRARRDTALPNFVQRELVPFAESHRSDFRTDIVWVCAVIAVDPTGSITLVWRVHGSQRPVRGQLLVVWTKAVALRVRVAEHAGLQDLSLG